MSKKILIVAAHPDDEVLGMGGTLCRLRDEGHRIAILILANGEDARGKASADAGKRLAQARAVAKRLRAELFLENFPDNQFDTVSLLSLCQAVEKIIAVFKPETVYTHFAFDLNVDHRRTFEAALTAARPQPGRSVKEIFSFEVLSSTEWQLKGHQSFSPNRYVDIAAHLKEKLELMKEYGGELRAYPHPRSPEGIKVLAAYRGLEAGLTAAEAFAAVRTIIS